MVSLISVNAIFRNEAEKSKSSMTTIATDHAMRHPSPVRHEIIHQRRDVIECRHATDCNVQATGRGLSVMLG